MYKTITMSRNIKSLPDKRVRFDPFVTYLGEEQPEPEYEESMEMDGAALGRRSKRLSMDLQAVFTDPPAKEENAGSFDDFGRFSGCFGNSSDLGIGGFLNGSLLDDENADSIEASSPDDQAAGDSYDSNGFLEIDDSDASFPDLGPLKLEEAPGKKTPE